MLVSSPIRFPESSSPPPRPVKRTSPSAARPVPSRGQRTGPFLIDEDEDEEEASGQGEGLESSAGADAPLENAPNPKRRMLHDPRPGAHAGSASASSEQAPAQVPPLEAAGNPVTTVQPCDVSASRYPIALAPPIFSGTLRAPSTYTATACNGKSKPLKERTTSQTVSYESMVASRSRTKEGRATRAYYGIDIHELIDENSKHAASAAGNPVPRPDVPLATIEKPCSTKTAKKSLLWTEKYRARNFMDLCGDDGTNRLVLRWLKKWDPVVFPGMAKPRPAVPKRPGFNAGSDEEKPHRKILLLTGPPGLGKTTLAHVCARQAGYEVMEINASDDRSRDVVKNRIRTSLGTESVKTVTNRKANDGQRKVAKPACVVVDEVDGVVSGSSGSGEGGFVKALIDLVLVDQKNEAGSAASSANSGRKKKGDDFRLMRPLILICNDVYHPSLRPLRQSNLAEIIHAGRPQMDAVVNRLKTVFEKEGIPCEKDAARKLCEAAWGVTSGIDAKRGAESTVEGDLRGVMVVGEWVAGRFKASPAFGNGNLTKHWIENNILHDLTSGAAGSRGLGRGSVKDIISRLFQEGGGFPKQKMDLSESKTRHEQPKTELGLGEQQKKYATERLGQMIETSGEISNIVTEAFAEYPSREYNDDLYLTKPNEAYEWLHFHDECQSRLYASQEWELAPYLSQPVLAWHHLFASPKRHYVPTNGFDRRWGQDKDSDEGPPLPFSGSRGDYLAREAEKQNRAQLQAMACDLSPTMMRLFRSAEDMATDLLPYLVRLVSPDVKPVVVGGSQGSTASVRKESEREMVRRAAEVLAEVGIALHRGKIESEGPERNPQFVYRMEPDLDALASYETASSILLASQAPTRYAVRQVLDQELRRAIAERDAVSRQARMRGLVAPEQAERAQPAALVHCDKENGAGGISGTKITAAVKRDFFGRIVVVKPLSEVDANAAERKARREEKKVWVTYHEGLNNAVRKPISLQEFLGGL